MNVTSKSPFPVHFIFTIFQKKMKASFTYLFLFIAGTLLGQTYFPGPTNQWAHKTPEEMKMHPDSIQSAITFAQENESDGFRNLEINHYHNFGREPFGDGVGPFKTRGDQTGIIIKDGFIIAEWGDPNRVDMTFSVTKSFLSSTVGIAFDQGIINDVHDKVDAYMAPIMPYQSDRGTNKADHLGEDMVIEPFKSPHNNKITWNHLLRQTSDWQGTLWGKPDWADRPSEDRKTWMTKERVEPGTVYEYNDTRVNLLALAATNIWRKPLQKVLKEHVMDPIGATRTWRWMGYENSWIIMDGQAVEIPSGGGHWGGGMFINAYDQARFGYLTLNRGKWKNKQILSEEWVTMALTPTAANTSYGFMNWFLNTDKKMLPSAPETAFFHLGAGTNMVYVDPVNNLVIVARWIDRSAMDGLVRRVINSLD